MKSITRIFVASVLAMTVSGVSAQTFSQGDVTVTQPWSRTTPPGVSVGVGYMAISNDGKAALTLVGASTPKAGKVTIHQSVMNDGLMSMRPLPGGLAIPAGETVMLEPHGYHLMLEELDGAIVGDEQIPLTLDFDTAGSVDIELRAMPMGPAEKSHSGHSH